MGPDRLSTQDPRVGWDGLLGHRRRGRPGLSALSTSTGCLCLWAAAFFPSSSAHIPLQNEAAQVGQHPIDSIPRPFLRARARS